MSFELNKRICVLLNWTKEVVESRGKTAESEERGVVRSPRCQTKIVSSQTKYS